MTGPTERRRAPSPAGSPGDGEPPAMPDERPPRPIQGNRYGRYLALLGAIVLVGILAGTILSEPSGGVRGIAPGRRIPPFAVPLALGRLTGKADIAVDANEGARGRVPACKERGPEILNICQLYERGPVVLALFIDGGSCPDVLGEMQSVSASFPDVGFAAVAIKAQAPEVRRLIRARKIVFPVGVSPEGELAPLYDMGSCPQLSFIYPGGRVQSRALLARPSARRLRARVAALLAASEARGWRPRA